jgi:hypothetical protein
MFLSIVRGMHALGNFLARRSAWIELHAITGEPSLACDDSDEAERHAKHSYGNTFELNLMPFDYDRRLVFGNRELWGGKEMQNALFILRSPSDWGRRRPTVLCFMRGEEPPAPR